MATYAFKALDLGGSPSKGEIEASDKQAVASQLRSRGLGHRQHGYAVASLPLGRRGELVERMRLREVEAADPGAAQRREVATDPKEVTEVAGQGPHIGA